MAQNEFMSSLLYTIRSLIVNRKITSMKAKINWLNIDTIENKRHEPFKLFLIETNNPTQSVVNLHKNGVTKEMFADAILPNTVKTKIKFKKFRDLMALLEFMPQKYHEFYKNLDYMQDEIDGEDSNDFGLASDSEFEDSDEDACKLFLNILHKTSFSTERHFSNF